MHQNVKVLKDKGYLYPFAVRRHLHMMNGIFSGKRPVAEVSEKILNRIAAHDQNIHTVILSDEDISIRRDLSPLAEFKDAFNVKIVYTLRRQDTWLESWYFQNIKWQWNEKLAHATFDQFMARQEDFHWIHYDRYVTHLENLFGKENVILNVHERDQMPDGPIAAFLNSIGLTDHSGMDDAPHINSRFSPKVSEFMRNLPLDEAPVAYRDALSKACARMDAGLHADQKRQSELLLPHDDRVALMAGYEAGNTAIAQRYFDRDQLFMAPLPGPDAPLADMTLPENSLDLMEQMVAPLILEMIADFKTQKK